MNEMPAPQTEMILPASVVSKLDVARLVREVEQLDRDLTTIAARAKVGQSTEWQPILSSQLSDLLAHNPLDLASAPQRQAFLQRLRRAKDNVPVIHMTFATTADQQSLQELVAWLRRSVHPQAVIAIGLQPDLVGGVYLRTTNHVHDLSVRAQLAGHRDIIAREVEAISAGR